MSDSSGNIASPATSSSNLTDLTLSVRIDGVPEQEVFLQHGLSIGRNPSNTICVSEPDIERIHAMVCKQADGAMLLECTDEHLRITLADGTLVHSLMLKPGATFKLGKAVVRCLKRETKSSVVVSDNPWEVQCPRCKGVVVDLPHDAHTCPHCNLSLQYFVSHLPLPPNATGGPEGEPEFSGWLPREVGPYKIRAFVAQGGMGIILRGLHEESDLPAAVKLLKSDPDEDLTWRARFMAEIEVLKTLRHPNVVHLQDSGKDDQLLWLAMDWIEGNALTKIIGRHRTAGENFPIDEAKQVLSQVVTGLKYLHDKQLIHRDLKPSNVLMANDGLVKLVDFGIAKGASGQTAVVTQLTHTGMVAGTESYMSPEQSEGQNITPASDVYSLGVMWYELVAGRRPVGAFAAPHMLRNDCPISWSTTIAQCLAVDPHARPSLDRILTVLTTNTAEPPPLPGQRGKAQPGHGPGGPATGVIQSGIMPSGAMAAGVIPTATKAWTPPPPTRPGQQGQMPGQAAGRAPAAHAPPAGPVAVPPRNVGQAATPSFNAPTGGQAPAVTAPAVAPPAGAPHGVSPQAGVAGPAAAVANPYAPSAGMQPSSGVAPVGGAAATNASSAAVPVMPAPTSPYAPAATSSAPGQPAYSPGATSYTPGATGVPPAGPQQGGSPAARSFGQNASKIAAQTGQAISSAARATSSKVAKFFEKHPPSTVLNKMGPPGKWVVEHRGPAIAIAAGVFLLILILTIRACSSDSPTTSGGGTGGSGPGGLVTGGGGNGGGGATGNLSPEQLYFEAVKVATPIANADDPAFKKVIDLLTQSANRGYTPAMNDLANLYADPRSHFYNANDAVFWARKANRAGDPRAMKILRQFNATP